MVGIECQVQEMEVMEAKLETLSWSWVPRSRGCRPDLVCGKHRQSLTCLSEGFGAGAPQGERFSSRCQEVLVDRIGRPAGG